MEDDQHLVQRVLAGDRAALHELIARHERLVRHVVFRLVPEHADAEEVCQDVFVRAVRGLADFRRESKLSTWIGRIAYRTALKRLEPVRARGAANLARLEPLDEAPAASLASTAASPLDVLIGAELRVYVRRQVEALAPEQRAAVTLYHLEGMTITEVAEVMELPANTVKSHLFRARRTLRKMLQDRIGGSYDG